MAVLTGKVTIVTGAGSGIGAASASRLAESGASVVVVDRDEASAHQVADRLGGLPVVADVSQPDQWGSIVDATVARFGGVDLAHLNAGVTTGEADISLLTDEQYRRAVGVNIDGVVFGIRALVPVLRQRGGGSLVATASLAGLIGYSPDPIYGLTKSAVVGLVRALAPQLAEQNIILNAICPSLVDTNMLDETARDALSGSGFPLIGPATVADAVFQCLTSEDTGRAMVIQAGREPLAYRFARPPGPRAEGAEGRLPPAALAAHDQE
ncbi:MAG: SDR family NAD(P)-dependent oxidoreductase [Acidimicrobiales bacterium]